MSSSEDRLHRGLHFHFLCKCGSPHLHPPTMAGSQAAGSLPRATEVSGRGCLQLPSNVPTAPIGPPPAYIGKTQLRTVVTPFASSRKLIFQGILAPPRKTGRPCGGFWSTCDADTQQPLHAPGASANRHGEVPNGSDPHCPCLPRTIGTTRSSSRLPPDCRTRL